MVTHGDGVIGGATNTTICGFVVEGTACCMCSGTIIDPDNALDSSGVMAE